jgi:uncharacterized protein involved in tolerance to divalent cations
MEKNEEITLKFKDDYEYYDAINEISYIVQKLDDPTIVFAEVERILEQFKEEE